MYLKVEMKIYQNWLDFTELCRTQCQISVNQKEPTRNIDIILAEIKDHLFRVLIDELNDKTQ